jgi:hypothetical protein
MSRPASATGIALHMLPVQLRMLVRLMGEAAAYRLVQERGGTPFTVPKNARSPQFAGLVDLVGIDAAAALVAELSGQTLHLPKYDGVLRQLRHQRVIDLRSRHRMQLADIALTTGYTVRQVINVLNAARMQDGLLPGEPAAARGQAHLQTDLFDDDDDAALAESAPAGAELIPAPPALGPQKPRQAV